MGRLTRDKLGFSGPGWSPLYPAPPHFYRNTENLLFFYETDLDPVLDLLPEEVEPSQENPIVMLWFQHAPFSTFGPHQGCYGYIECVFRGEKYLYMPYLWVTSDSALAAGRELWGDAKKLADIKINIANEEIVATLERPTGVRLITARLRVEGFASPDDLGLTTPGLCIKMIPGVEQSDQPAILQLVEDAMTPHPVIGSDGRAEVFGGPASVTFDSPSQLSPISNLVPRQMLRSYYALMHIDLDYGKVLKEL
jgi:acetoacetate decarboxylase